jgi:hypothetical protein
MGVVTCPAVHEHESRIAVAFYLVEEARPVPFDRSHAAIMSYR